MHNNVIIKLKKIASLMFMGLSCAYAQQPNDVNLQLRQLEESFGGRVGIYAINTANNATISYRAAERFAMCSTSKLMVVAANLKKSENSPKELDEIIHYNQQDLDSAEYTPITSKFLATGMNIKDLSAAAMSYSDNLAMNLLIAHLGITKVNKFAKSIKDLSFRLDRTEPTLNTAIPNDPRDTSTPKSMATSLKKIILGDVLHDGTRAMLFNMMKNNNTGDHTIRSALPKTAIVLDKTGSGDYGTRNDIAVVWLNSQTAPIVLAIYTTQPRKDAKPNDAVVASATKIVLEELLADDYSCSL
jgi:beta-lactamase class A